MATKLEDAEGEIGSPQKTLDERSSNTEYLENQSRWNNIRLSGIPESADATESPRLGCKIHHIIPIFLVIDLSINIALTRLAEVLVSIWPIATNFKCVQILLSLVIRLQSSLFVEVNRPKERNLLITRISKGNKKCYIMTDWNIDFTEASVSWQNRWIFRHNVLQIVFPISRPTRITSNSAKLIDNIFTNDPNNCSANGLLFTDNSDHVTIFTILFDHCKNTSKNIYVTFRDKNATNMAAFKAELQISNWDDVTGHSDPNSAYETILNKYSASYIRCFPLKKVKARNGCLNKPWLSKRLLKSINRKNILYPKHVYRRTSRSSWGSP